VTDASTETGLGDGGAATPTADAPYLFVVLEAARPLAGAARLRCDDLDEIVVGRGDPRHLVRRADSGRRVAALAIPDRRMSSVHARITRTPAGWELADAGSKNGCRVDGVPASRAALRDGAWLELGQTVLRFRTALSTPPAPAAAPWHDTDTAPPVLGIATAVPAFAAQLDALARLAPSRVSLLLSGATGTGKELLARGIHAASQLAGRPGPFVAVNCAALPEELVESQLFGHRRGAFSGALSDHQGLVRAADSGTLLLDEIGDLPLPAQAALLRVLQEREVLPVGATRPIPVDVRVIAATHHDLPALVAAGEFRADLYARLAGHVEALPPLAARREDIGTIVAAALRRHAGARAAALRLSLAAAARLVRAPWPANAREVDKAIEAALALAGDSPEIDAAHLPPPPAATPDDAALRARLDALLVEHRGNISQIARELGKARMQVQRWLKRFALDPARYR
jgi:transcriptional regulator of acetoin/glycerol metabolism